MVFVIDDYFLRHTILLFLWLEYIWESYLMIRQLRKVERTVEVPKELKNVMTKEVFDKAKSYTQAQGVFGFVKDTFMIIIATFFITAGVFASIWEYAESINPAPGEVLTSCIWFFLLNTISKIIELPLTIYHTFFLEEKYGFNKQTYGFFVWDKIKSFILTQVLTLSITSIVVVVIKNGGDYFFVWLWLVVFIISLVLLTIYPSVIAPLFDKYTPLPEGELRTQIESLASQLKFPLAQLYVVEGSKRSSHSNAYFYGVFKTKRIVLFDTLLKKDDGSGCTNEEILSVLSHELGHWNYSHVLKNLVVMEVNLLLLFAGFSYMFKSPILYRSMGFYNVQPVLVGLIILLQYVLIPYNAILSFLMTCLSRKFEFQADAFAAKLGKTRYLISALVQLNKDNLGFPIYDYLYSAWHHSHPPLLERIEVLRSIDRKTE